MILAVYTSKSKMLILTNNEDPDEMSHYAAFHQYLHYTIIRERKVIHFFSFGSNNTMIQLTALNQRNNPFSQYDFSSKINTETCLRIRAVSRELLFLTRT